MLLIRLVLRKLLIRLVKVVVNSPWLGKLLICLALELLIRLAHGIDNSPCTEAVTSDPPPRSLNEIPRQNSFTFRKCVCPSPHLKALETSFEAQVRDYVAAHTERIERMEYEKSVKNNRVVGEDMVEPNKSDLERTLKEVDGKGKVENRTNNEPAGNTKENLTGEKVRELVEMPRSHPVRFYLKHKIIKELIEGLVGNSRFNNSLLAMQSGKIECEAYHSLSIESMHKAMPRNMITKKEDIRATS
ncbi:hypothetical protein Tco_1263166 [Tanacetum coccineum]